MEHELKTYYLKAIVTNKEEVRSISIECTDMKVQLTATPHEKVTDALIMDSRPWITLRMEVLKTIGISENDSMKAQESLCLHYAAELPEVKLSESFLRSLGFK